MLLQSDPHALTFLSSTCSKQYNFFGGDGDANMFNQITGFVYLQADECCIWTSK
jgi:hypothetical protein